MLHNLLFKSVPKFKLRNEAIFSITKHSRSYVSQSVSEEDDEDDENDENDEDGEDEVEDKDEALQDSSAHSHTSARA